MRSIVSVLLSAYLLIPIEVGNAQGNARRTIFEGLRNRRPAFYLRINTENNEREFVRNDQIRLKVRSSEDGFLYVFYLQADGTIKCILPNQFEHDNTIRRKTPFIVPSSKFKIPVAPPFGRETFKAIVTKEKLNDAEQARLIKGLVEPEVVRGMVLERAEGAWAEAELNIWTFARERRTRPRRLGIFVGISNYKDARISSLGVCHRDAQLFRQKMNEKGGLSESVLLCNGDATKQNVVDAIQRLALKARAGDEVILYWSGHGTRLPDDNGDETRDGMDEFLVTYDAALAGRRTLDADSMLSDDFFGRLLLDFEGCRIAAILDTCHSGGNASNEKSIFPGKPPRQANPSDVFDFFENELSMIEKDLSGSNIIVLSSSRASESSYVRKSRDLSVMTSYLLRTLEQKSMSVSDAFGVIGPQVSQYVRRTYRRSQTPVLIGNTKLDFPLTQ